MVITKSILLALAALSLTLPVSAHQDGVTHHQNYEGQKPLQDHQHHNDGMPVQEAKRVAIIGAGSAGSSAAHYLRRFHTNTTNAPPINITIYERNAYIGGRSTTVNAHGKASYPIELGASIFVSMNENLVNAAKEFDLTVSSTSSTRPKTVRDSVGVFNGEEMVFVQPYSESKTGKWWSLAKLLYQYGPLAPIRTKRLTDETVGRFLNMYREPLFPFSSLGEAAESVGLLEATGVTGEQFLMAKGVGNGKFVTELMQASTRVNYGQNLGLIHGLETMVCMAAEGAVSVEGGNWQIFEGMVKSSGASVHLNTSVTGITEKKTAAEGDKKVWTITSQKHGDQSVVEKDFDTVIIASPYQYLDLTHPPTTLQKAPDKIPYVALHVTLFTSRRPLDPAYFNLDPASTVPEAVLTTLNVTEQSSETFTRGEGASAVGKVGFFSISTLRQIYTEEHGEEFVYKVFSSEAFGQDRIRKILGVKDEEEAGVTWVFRHLWNAYPYLYPRVTFEDIKLGEGMYYTAGIESFISTMETSSLMGMNVARLALDEVLGVEGKVKAKL
ncbi:Prenylcysteine oxidase [Choiromyces venosus 120613-1]|uniref:Prenylcysteine oxidase n=1 Tax=Choiromyces venosus 120613-1 TaxID=1336337 RepID=A0A3N4JLL9_9PEZI|nr:Prenylcysteine oxidase [Choiromyces venosus 120613-1]